MVLCHRLLIEEGPDMRVPGPGDRACEEGEGQGVVGREKVHSGRSIQARVRPRRNGDKPGSRQTLFPGNYESLKLKY